MKIEELLNSDDCHYDFTEDMDPLHALFSVEEMPLDDNDRSAIEAIHSMLIGLVDNDIDNLQELLPFPIEYTEPKVKQETSSNFKRKKSPKKLSKKKSKRTKKELHHITWPCTCKAKFKGKLYNSLFRHIEKYHINDDEEFECPYIKDCNEKPCKRPSKVIHHLMKVHNSFLICCKTVLVTQKEIEEHKNHIKMNQRIFKKN